MPNQQWREICTRGRALREAAGTLAGHAAGDNTTRAVDQASVVKALRTGQPSAEPDPGGRAEDMAEPLASVVAYLGDGLDDREFVPTGELVDALGVEPTLFGRQMRELGCQPVRDYAPGPDGTDRRVRGYATAAIRAAVDAKRTCGDEPGGADGR